MYKFAQVVIEGYLLDGNFEKGYTYIGLQSLHVCRTILYIRNEQRYFEHILSILSGWNRQLKVNFCLNYCTYVFLSPGWFPTRIMHIVFLGSITLITCF